MRIARNIGWVREVDLVKAILATRYSPERRRGQRLGKEQS